MHKKIASGVIIIAILAFLFSSLTAQAGIIGTIGQKGLAMASPELHTLLQTTACVSTGVTCASNYLAGQVTGEVMQQVAESSPEAAQLLKVNNKVEEWKKYGAQISEDLKVDDKGQIVGGSTTAVTRQIDISSEVGSDLKEGSIVAGPGVKTSFGQEGEDCTMAATEDGSYQKIGDQTYGNLAKGSFTKVSREGELTEAEIQTTEDGTTYIIKDQKFELNKGEKATYKEGKLTFSCVDGEGKDASCAGQTLKINDKDITINKGNIEFDGETFTGEDFTIDGTNVKSLTPGTPAEAKIVDKGLAIRNAVAETDEF
ncbi:MAG: hypothetical protein KKA79_00205, partial [Nanoarchaeota archaeon]|nr:hypothetical protein [Nanoarchaeota archaeon]